MPVEADRIEAPEVRYGGPDSIDFMTIDGRWGRVLFEKLDSLRVSRGEYSPYPGDDDPRAWVHVVERSPWLRERHAYEKRYYAHAYEFGGDVDEMLTDFSHYLFRFHDQFVEVLSAGIWFDFDEQPLGVRTPADDHPFLDLAPAYEVGTLSAHGLTCRVRRNPRRLEELVADAALCSQKLLQFVLELDGSTNVAWTVAIRARDGRVQSCLLDWFGNAAARRDGIASLEDVRPHVEAWLRDVRDRRSAMGKR